MARCIATLIAFAVPWIAFWTLVVLIATGLLATGPIISILVALALTLGVSLALLVSAYRQCRG
ncbi:MAG: hypothetical protein ACR2HX_20865 [Pyrinomonadaceae bacterium]